MVNKYYQEHKKNLSDGKKKKLVEYRRNYYLTIKNNY